MSDKNIKIEETSSVSNPSRKKNKKSNPILSFFSLLLSALLILVLLLVVYGAFSFLDRKSSLSAVPRNYSVYLHSDSAFGALNPLVDLKAADVFLSSPDFVKFRSIFMSLRSSKLRQNKFFKILASRPIDFALYDVVKNSGGFQSKSSQNFVAVVDLGFLSALTRPAKWYVDKIPLQNLSQSDLDGNTYFTYRTMQGMYYIKPVKNLLLASTDLDLLMQSALNKNDVSYSPEEKKLLSSKKSDGFRVVADAKKLGFSFAQGNEILKNMISLLSDDRLSVISFNVSDSDISLKCQLPISTEESNPLSNILKKNSTVPPILSRLSDCVQYYTILNAGSLEELKHSVFPFVPKDKNIEKNWQMADSLCVGMFGMGLSDLLFSWSGSNFALLGVENQNQPVIAIQVSDEKQRKKVFEKINSSILLDDSNTLILGGSRLSRIKMPDFILKILSSFSISIPSPYYFVQDGFIYFSQSAECLSEIYSCAKENRALVKNNSWKIVSSGQKSDSHVSVFYDLEKNPPSFIRGNKGLSNILRLYNIGRLDVRVKKNVLELQLQSCAEKSGGITSISGFPVKINGSVDCEDFAISSDKKTIFWLENGNSLNALKLFSLARSEKNLPENSVILTPKKDSLSGGLLWVVSDYGTVSFFNESFENIDGFPLVLDSSPSARPSACENGIMIPLEDEKVAFVKENGTVFYEEIPELSVKSSPCTLENISAVYDKGFLGKIYYFEDEKCTNKESPVEVSEIGLGTPALLRDGNKLYTAFVSQSGTVEMWLDGMEGRNFPVKLPGVFHSNLVASKKYFYAISSDAVLYRISLDGKILSVRIPDATGKAAWLKVDDRDQDGKLEVYVNADSNLIYAFTEDLELISGFPLSGFGKPLFADGNGDNVADVFALSIDKKINAWTLR